MLGTAIAGKRRSKRSFVHLIFNQSVITFEGIKVWTNLFAVIMYSGSFKVYYLIAQIFASLRLDTAVLHSVHTTPVFVYTVRFLVFFGHFSA